MKQKRIIFQGKVREKKTREAEKVKEKLLKNNFENKSVRGEFFQTKSK